MANFIKINALERNNLFKKAKEKVSTYPHLSKELGVTRDMIFKYKRGDCLIPQITFDKLVKISSFNPKKFDIIVMEKYLKKCINKPILDQNLAEVLGVLNGDGHLSKINHEVSVTGNLGDTNYFLYLKKKFEELFKMKFNIEKFNHYLKLRGYSKELIDFLTKEFELPKGRKMGKLGIPKEIFSDKNLLANYFRGLFDTDGTFYIRRKKDPVVEISSGDHVYLEQIKGGLKFIDFEFGIRKKNVYLYKKEDIKRFFEVIKPANPKHLKKFNLYFN